MTLLTNKMTLKEHMLEATKHEMLYLAYAIYAAVDNQQVQWTSSWEDLLAAEQNSEQIKQLVEENPLGINKYLLYTAKSKQGGYHLVFAKNAEEAVTHILKKTNELIVKAIDITDRKNQFIEYLDGQEIWLLDYKPLVLPYYIGLYDKTTGFTQRG